MSRRRSAVNVGCRVVEGGAPPAEHGGDPAEGWVEVARSADVAGSKPLAVRCLGRDLVCYRGRSGRVHVIDGLCPHMRVSFAGHGIVEGEGITCRFHGWIWDGEGRNVRVTMQRRAIAAFDLRSYPVREAGGRVLVRLGPKADSPRRRGRSGSGPTPMYFPPGGVAALDSPVLIAPPESAACEQACPSG